MVGVVVLSGRVALEVGGDLDQAHQERLVAGRGRRSVVRHVEVLASAAVSHDSFSRLVLFSPSPYSISLFLIIVSRSAPTPRGRSPKILSPC